MCIRDRLKDHHIVEESKMLSVPHKSSLKPDGTLCGADEWTAGCININEHSHDREQHGGVEPIMRKLYLVSSVVDRTVCKVTACTVRTVDTTSATNKIYISAQMSKVGLARTNLLVGFYK